MIKQNYTITGLMSGTSLDGVDLATCHFEPGTAQYEILKATTVSYSNGWKEKLGSAQYLDAQGFWRLHTEYGHYLGQLLSEFHQGVAGTIDAVASHGHTVFHQPQNGFTCQIGDGAAIAAKSELTTICDFRSMDVALGGQGAPLVPIGDKLLFPDYQACLNIGGIANISFDKKNERIAFDVSPANLVFNALAQRSGKAFDENGAMAVNGSVNTALLTKLNTLSYYSLEGKKSIGREWVEKEVLTHIDESGLSDNDKMATASEHAAMQVAAVLNKNNISTVLITGGGAYNGHLLSRLAHYSTAELVIPEKKIVEFKEALIFAYLGMLRLEGKNNALAGVTGAKKDSVGGAVYYFKK